MLKRYLLTGLIFLVLLGGINGAAGEPSSAGSDAARVILINGDEMQGELTSISNNVLSLKSAFAVSEEKMLLKNVRQICLRYSRGKVPSGPDSVFLTGGDVLSGKLISLDEKKMVLKTGYAANVSIGRKQVKAIIFGTRLIFADDFSEKSDRWTIHSGEWNVTDGKLRQRQSKEAGWQVRAGRRGSMYISSKVEQKTSMTYEWEMTTKEFLSGGLVFFANGVEVADNRKDCYTILVDPRGYVRRFHDIYFYRGDEKIYYRFPGNTRELRFKAAYDPETGRLNVWANEKLIIDCKDAYPLKYGSLISFSAKTPVMYDNVKIWQGWRDLSVENTKGSEKADLIYFKNGDRLTGEVRMVDERRINFATRFAMVPIEREKILRIVFNQEKVAVPERTEKAAKVTLGNLDEITLNVKSLDGHYLIGKTAYSGEMKIKRGVLKEILFKEQESGASKKRGKRK